MWAGRFLLVLFGSTALLFYYLLRRDLVLFRYGHLAPGVVRDVKHWRSGRVLYYEFLFPDGSIGGGSGPEAGSRVETGTAITVVYTPDNPKRNQPYPSRLLRVRKEPRSVWRPARR
jgi:hypothetical protein